MTAARIRPPNHLKASRKYFLGVVRDFEIPDHKLPFLVALCVFMDEIVAKRKLLAEKGATFDDRFGQPKSRPEIAHLRDARLAACRLANVVGLPASAPPWK